jgi:hypothetical protein
MKKFCTIALVFVLTASLFTGCGCPNTDMTTTAPLTSSTRPTVMPKPELPLPSGTNTTAPGGSTNDTTLPNRMVRPTQGPRY